MACIAWVMVATILASAVLQANAAAPTIASDGQDLLIEAGEGGDVVFRLSDVEIKLSQLNDVVATVAQQTQGLVDHTAGINDLSTDVQQIREAAIATGAGFETRLAALEAKVDAIPTAFDPGALVRDLQALTAAVNKITAALCDDGGDCSVTLPSCKPSEAEAGADDANMVVDWAGDHGKDVPVGVVASFACKEGYGFADSTDASEAALSTCRSDGWTAFPDADVCSKCKVDGCGTCPDLDTCDGCVAGKALVLLGRPGPLELDASMVSFNLNTLREGGGITGNAKYATAEDMKECMLDGVHSPKASQMDGKYQKCPTFSADKERAWVQLDLGALHHVSQVTFWQYYTDGRAYVGQGVAVSKTGQFGSDDTVWLFNRGMDEKGPRSTATGLVTNAAENTAARYIRIYSGGSPGSGDGAHFIEVAVEGTSQMTTACE